MMQFSQNLKLTLGMFFPFSVFFSKNNPQKLESQALFPNQEKSHGIILETQLTLIDHKQASLGLYSYEHA